MTTPGGKRGAAAELLAQSDAITIWLADLPADAWEQPSVLEGWDVRTLVAHVLLAHTGLARTLDRPTREKPQPLVEYARRCAEQSGAGVADDAAREAAADLTPAGARHEFENVRADLATRLDDPPRTVDTSRGPVLAADYLRMRVVELVVHGDDLSRSVPNRPLEQHRPALATATRTLAQLLAAQAPGHSVELRVPPFVAVQAVDGPRHTRGTPPNVVETDPTTWLRLATGRQSFAATVAEGRTRASGNRADLSAFLPVLA